MAASAYSVHLLVGQVTTCLKKLLSDPSQVRDLPGVLSNASIVLQGVLVAWPPHLLESFEQTIFLGWTWRMKC